MGMHKRAQQTDDINLILRVLRRRLLRWVPMVEEGDSQADAPDSQGVSASVGSGLGGPKGSWVGAVQGTRCLKKYDVEILMKDGVGSVVVPEEITKDVAPLWEDFLIGKFLDDAPHIAKIHAIVNKIWNINDKKQMIDVFEVNSTSMKFRVSTQADRNRILRRGMWNLAGIPVVVTKWSPVVEKEKAPKQSIPMWVHLKNVPINMFSWKGLSFVSSPIGIPVKLHPETAQCLDLEVAKIFMKVDLTTDLPKKLVFNIQGQDVEVEYLFPWLPTKCPKCEKWGHSLKACPGNKGEQIVIQKEKEVIVVKQSVRNEEVVTATLELDVVPAQAQDQERVVNKELVLNTEEATPIVLNEENGNIEKLEEVSMEVKQRILPVENVVAETTNSSGDNSSEIDKEREWLGVSPGKASRSPIKNRELEFGQTALLTNSRFAVLSSEEEGEIVEKEEEFEGMKGMMVEDSSGKERVMPRQSLPRESKMKHKILGDKSVQKAQDASLSDLNKRKPRSN